MEPPFSSGPGSSSRLGRHGGRGIGGRGQQRGWRRRRRGYPPPERPRRARGPAGPGAAAAGSGAGGEGAVACRASALRAAGRGAAAAERGPAGGLAAGPGRRATARAALADPSGEPPEAWGSGGPQGGRGLAAGGRAQAAPPLPLGGLRAAQRRRPGSAGVELRRPRPELHGRGSLSRARWPPAQGSSSRPLFIPRLWSSLFQALPWVREVQP